MRKLALILPLLWCVGWFAGCSSDPKTLPHPTTQPIVAKVGDTDGTVLTRTTIDVNGVETPILRVDVHRGVHGTKYTIYTKDCTLEADYPMNFVGPLPPGHAYVDGSHGNCP